MIGISRDIRSFSYTYLSIIKKCGYKGKIYPVNPKAKEILGLKCYSSILDIPNFVDLAFVITPRKIISFSIGECIKKKVKGIVIVTAGFAEKDSVGKILQNSLIEKAKENGVRVIGPNTLGLYSSGVKLDALLSGFIKKGNIALVTQSGNITRSLAFPGVKRGLGFSYIIGLGNQADLQFHEIISFLREDKKTRVIALHIEGLIDGRKFIEEVQKTVKNKPVIVLKSGRSKIGAEVVSSHTASLAGNDEIYSAVFKQSGAIQVHSIYEFISLLIGFNHGKIPKSNKVGIISEGGGDCAITADICIDMGLDLAVISPEIKSKLKKIVPDIGSIENPIDLATNEIFSDVTEVLLEDKNIDGLLVVGGVAGWDFLNPNVLDREKNQATKMSELIKKSAKPVLIYSYYNYEDSEPLKILKDRNIPIFQDHFEAVRSMAALAEYSLIKLKIKHKNFSCAQLQKENKLSFSGKHKKEKNILEPFLSRILEDYSLASPISRVFKDKDGAARFAEKIGFPVVMKISSKDIIHRSDYGCVKLNLNSGEEVDIAFEEILKNTQKFSKDVKIEGVQISKMVINEGIEIIIGGLYDPVFGPVIMFGLGGFFVEVQKDTSIRICPVDEITGKEMIEEIKSYPILKGARNNLIVDIGAIIKALNDVSRLLIENPSISQIDLNPLKVFRKGLTVLDALIMLK